MTSQTTFEERLLDRLRLVVAANAARPTLGARQARRPRWPLVTAGLAAAGVAAALAVVIPGGTQAAYAIDSQPDGSVTVHIASLRDAAGLQAALRDRGIPAIVDYSATCRSVSAPRAGSGTRPYAGGRSFSEVKRAPAARRPRSAREVGVRAELSKKAGASNGVTFEIDPASIPVGRKVYITTYSGQLNAVSIRVGSRPPTPPCPPAIP